MIKKKMSPKPCNACDQFHSFFFMNLIRGQLLSRISQTFKSNNLNNFRN